MYTLMRLTRYFPPLPLRCILVVLVVFWVALMAGYNFGPDFGTKDSLVGLDFVNYRDRPYVLTHVAMAEKHQKFLRFIAHNGMVCVVVLCLGPVIFFYPLIKASLLGFIIGVGLWNLGSPWLWGRFFLPHSLVELPVILYVDAIAMRSGLRWLAGGPEGRRSILRHELATNLKLFLLLIPLIIFAAYLEAYITCRW